MLDWSDFHIFLLEKNKKEITMHKNVTFRYFYAKIIKGQNFLVDVLKSFLQHRCLLILEMFKHDNEKKLDGKQFWMYSALYMIPKRGVYKKKT